MSIVVTGAIFLDVKGFPSGYFDPTGRNAGTVEYVQGGVSRNIVENIANIGLDATFLSLTDDSGAGRDAITHLKKHNVHTDYIECVPGGMGTWLAIFDECGDVYASISQRPDLTPLKNVLDVHGDEIFSKADSFLLEIDMDEELVKEFFRYTQKFRVPVYAAVSNIGIAMRRKEYLRLCSCFVCNLSEASKFFSQDLNSVSPETLPDRLLMLISDAGIHSMVVTAGKDGCYFASADGARGHLPSMDVRVIDTTGAGDAFFAGTSSALTFGMDLRSACHVGTTLAASVVPTVASTCSIMDPLSLGFPKKAIRQK